MRISFSVLLLLVAVSPAAAGAFGKIGGSGLFTSSEPDCSTRTPTPELPPWSRLEWSLASGLDSRRVDRTWHHGAALVPQASVALLTNDSRCAGGGGFLGTYEWVRWSLGASGDLVWRTQGPIDMRPALRLARSNYFDGFLTVGSSWVPSLELALTVGPTFDPTFSGGAASISAHASILSIELRAGLRTESRGQEVMLLFGVADIHGLFDLGDRARD